MTDVRTTILVWIRDFFDRRIRESALDGQIMILAGGWMRYNAVAAYNGSLMEDFKLWKGICKNTWMSEVANELGISVSRVCKATERFAQSNSDREAELRISITTRDPIY